jgi:hypothetical protein
VHPVALFCFYFEAQICYFRLPNPSHIRKFTVFEPGLTLIKFRISFFFATPSLQHNSASYIPTLNVPSLTKIFFVYLCPNNSVQAFIGLLSFPIKASLQKIYTSKIPEDWLNCIW